MINNKKILAIIPAREGSKGLKNKNIASLNGVPLIGYTIKSALQSKYIDNVIVSTDSQKIRLVSLKYGAGVPFLRPKRLATDHAKVITAIVHSIKKLKEMGKEYDIIILLQTTSPLRKVSDIDGAIDFFIKNKYKGLASVTEVIKHPILMRKIGKNNKLIRVLNKASDVRRQDMDKYYYIDGAIYINKISEINESTSLNDNHLGYIMSQRKLVDIDEAIDLTIAEAIIKKNLHDNN